MEHSQQAWQKGLQILQPSESQLQHGLELHDQLGVCDAYGFLPRVFNEKFCESSNKLLERGVSKTEWRRKYWSGLAAAPGSDPQVAQESLEALRKARLRAIVQPVNDVGESLEDAIELIAAFRHQCNVLKEHLFQVTCAEDLEDTGYQGKTGLLFSLTGLPVFGAGSMADPDGLLDWVDVWYRFGVRFMHLGYNRRNYFADGCTEKDDGGISDLGRELIVRLNRTGIVVDVPHSSPQTLMQAVAYANRPLVASHTGCRAVHDYPRCKSDQELKAIASTGGYVGIFSIPTLLGPSADINLMLRHVQHAIEVIGTDHVVIGTDGSYVSSSGMESLRVHPGQELVDRAGWRAGDKLHASREHLDGSLAWTNWPLFTVGLVKMGLSDEDIGKILGGNLRRVLRACQPEAEKRVLQQT